MRRMEVLKRLGAVYGLVEEIHSIEARKAQAELSEAENALHLELRTLQAAWVGEKEALGNEDLMSRSSMMAQGVVANQKKGQIEPLLESRKETREAAKARQRESQISSEQMKSLIERESERVAMQRERRDQATSDDRFLTLNRRQKKKPNAKMRLF